MSEVKSDQRTLVTFLLDRTGAAEPIRGQTINAFNAFLETLKASGDSVEFTLIQFDHKSFDPVHVCKPIRNMPTLKARTYVAPEEVPRDWRGMHSPETLIARFQIPLIDAAYKTTAVVAESLQRRDDRPKVVICIHADGVEGSSTEHTWEELDAVIKDKTAQGWQLNFLGGGLTVYEQGCCMGIAVSHIATYAHPIPRQKRKVFLAAAANISAFACGEQADTAFSAQQKSYIGNQYIPRGLSIAQMLDRIEWLRDAGLK